MFEWLDRVGKLNHTGQRFLHRMSVRSQLFSEQGRHVVQETVEEGKEALQSVASTLLHSLATPVAWTDDVLNHRVHFLGWTREQLNHLAQELEPKRTEEAAQEAPAPAERTEKRQHTGAESVAWPDSGERRRYERRQFSRPGTGRRSADRAVKEQAEQIGPTIPQDFSTPTTDRTFAAEPVTEPIQTGVFVSPTGSPVVVSSEDNMLDQEPISASLAEIVASHEERLAIKDYDQLNVHKIIAALRKVDVKDMPELLAYEKTHKNRRSVLDAMQRILVHGRPAVA